MNSLSEWKVAQKIQASGKKGIIIGLLIAGLIILAVVGTIVKIYLIKKHFGCLNCDMDDFDDCCCGKDDCDCDEDGCCYTEDKDFA